MDGVKPDSKQSGHPVRNRERMRFINFLKYLIFICIVLLISTSDLISAELNKFLLNNGKVITGKITDKKEDGTITVLTKDGFTITLEEEDIVQIIVIKYPDIGSIGLGMGIPYGYQGLNLDVAVYKKIYITAGYGMTYLIDEDAYNIGVKYYFEEIGKTWRPRVFLCVPSMEWTPDFVNTPRSGGSKTDWQGRCWQRQGLKAAIGS
ncbi:MAG: hypothetical protein P9L92_03675, partial [Candidatus Electryonea clarkiae]|nr:hypothetical protein [Candidatus Electryonea clarkiae]MDP8286105.1 hypothetical protein [Candidatus Electryonea clarkiae]